MKKSDKVLMISRTKKKTELVKEYETKLQNMEFGLGQSTKTELKQ